MDLAKKVLDAMPDWLKVRVTELDEIEKLLFDTSREIRKKTSNPFGHTRGDIREYEEGIKEMRRILQGIYANGRFKGYFQNQVYSLTESIKTILGY